MTNVKITNVRNGIRIRTHLMVIADSVRFGKDAVMFEGQLFECEKWLFRKGIMSYKANF